MIFQGLVQLMMPHCLLYLEYLRKGWKWLQDNKKQFNECVEKIVEWYIGDTIELLDLVLTDDLEDPQYSAITTCKRLNEYLLYQELRGNQKKDLTELLMGSGYTQEDIDLLMVKKEQEKELIKKMRTNN